MASKPIREYDAKLLLAHWLPHAPAPCAAYPDVSSDFKYPKPRVAQMAWNEEDGNSGLFLFLLFFHLV
jgi:ATP citrate (pro-S)-lyase